MKLYLDANIIILGHEGEDLRKQTVLHRLWQCVSEDGGELITSAFSRLECLVLPLRSKDQALLADYDRFFGSESLTIVDVTTSVLTRAASLRAEYRFKTPDAIHLASAIEADADSFFTADRGLRRCPGLAIELLAEPPTGLLP